MTGLAVVESPYDDPKCPYGEDHPVRFETATPITASEKWYCRVCKDHFILYYTSERQA